MHYIVEIGSRLYFRRRIPEELHSVLGFEEIKRSLHTKRMDDAKAIAAHLNEKLERLFVALSSGVSMETIVPILDLKLRKRRRAPADIPPVASVMYQRLADEMVATRQWNEKTVNENRLAFNVFLSLMGDPRIDEVTHSMLMDYRGRVQQLPPNGTKAKTTRDTSLRELVQITHAKTITVTRVNHILMPITGLFRWLQKHEFIRENPAHNILLPKGRSNVRQDEERKRYSNQEIRMIIEAVGEYRHTQPERFFVPIICAHSALRVSECCQMGLENVKNIDGIWAFEINEGKDRRLKSRSASRIIPIHPFVLAQGFLAYADQLHQKGEERLFPNLRKHSRNGYGHQIIAWWCRFKTRISPDPKLSFHSLRHSACDELKQRRVDPAIIAEIMGHSVGLISLERYGKRFSPKILLEAIQQIDFAGS